MAKLMDFFRENYYTSLLLIVTGLAAIQIAFKYRKKFPILKFIPLYLCVSVFQSLFNCLIFLNWHSDLKYWLFDVNNYIILIFIALETTIFGNFLSASISNRILKRSIRAFQIPLLMFFGYLLLFSPLDHRQFTIAYTVETCYLIVPCLFYYYEILRKVLYFNPLYEPSFWVITGLTLFLLTTLPYTMIQDYIARVYDTLFNRLQTLFYISYSLFFGLIIRAYLCKPRQVQLHHKSVTHQTKLNTDFD